MGDELVLVVDDEANIRDLCRMYFERDGFRVETADTGPAALEKAGSNSPSLIVLDLMLPELDGYEVCRRLRAESDVPIIMLTARDEDVDKIVGLELGADDYLTKPFNPRELVARAKAILRRSARTTVEPMAPIAVGDVSIDPGRHEVTVAGQAVELRAKEFDLLQALAVNKGFVFTRERLLDQVWGYDFYGQTRTVDVHIAQLRKHLARSKTRPCRNHHRGRIQAGCELMFASLRARLLLSYLLVAGLVLALVAIGFFTFLVSNPFGDRIVYQRLETIATAVGLRESAAAPANQLRTIDRMLTLLGGRFDARALVLASTGEILVDTSPQGPLPSETDLHRLGSLTDAVQGSFAADSGRAWLYIAQPMAGSRTLVVAAPRLTLRTVPYALALEGLPGPILAAAALALIVSLALAWLLSRWISAPLRRMASAARQVAGGNYEVRIHPSGPQEAQDVALAFNHMVDEVRLSQRVQRDFVANVSHELKTPLTSIQGFAQAIKDGAVVGEEGRRHAAQVIYDETDRLGRLVEELLDLARLESGQSDIVRGTVDVGALLTRVADQQAVVAADCQIEIVRKWPSDLPSIVGDGDRLAQVFINLIDNAIRHSAAGDQVELDASTASGWLKVAVADHGPGIASEDQVRIFERFYKLDKARTSGGGRGFGLGLAISAEIVGVHGGRIELESSPGRGSRFTVALPLSLPDDTTQARQAMI